jgi:hypothetical protein
MPFRWDEATTHFVHGADGVDPEIVGKALGQISAKNGGRLRPAHVVDAARPPRHSLHRHFIWDDRKAAELHRLDQARALIRSIVVVDDDADDDDQSRPAFVSVVQDGRAYRAIDEVLRSPDLQLRLLQRALDELRAFERRYHRFEDICTLVRPARTRAEERLAAAKPESRP